MNIYDFDGTIYHGESSTDFFFYCLKRYPKTWKYVLPTMFYGLGYLLRIVKKTKFKSKFLRFAGAVDDIDQAVEDFWKINIKKVHKWYLEKKNPTDIVITASPEYLIKPIGKMLGVERVIGSRVDKHIGIFYGTNYHGEEKVRRLMEIYPDAHVNEFYSDMYSDTPLAMLAERAYIVKGERLKPWKFKNKKQDME
ncbi:MAG: haloacid dehalogenase-like hydrolase [Clostridia bacterium]|nr:haloacid dehalogenase-like hydrolase [Clostridia bacterium]